MKLLYCKACRDIVRLTMEERACQCGKTKGAYKQDRWHAWYSGSDAVPLGFRNDNFLEAIRSQPSRPPGRVFTAFVIESDCKTFERIGS